jgi:hypothetical protein
LRGGNAREQEQRGEENWVRKQLHGPSPRKAIVTI